LLLVFLVLCQYCSSLRVTTSTLSHLRGLRRLQMGGRSNVPHHTVVLIRHGLSLWNEENRFTGWADVPLSPSGEAEAKEGGRLMKEAGLEFDMAFTSVLKRAIKTLNIGLEELDLLHIPVFKDWRLNERHYGALQGLNKQDTVTKYGKDQVLVWRRSYDIPPPELDINSEHHPCNDPKHRYDTVSLRDMPKAESLKTTEDRSLVYWKSKIVPEIKKGKKILIAAHGNTLRALVKYLDNIPDDVITELNIPTGVPLVYNLDAELKPFSIAAKQSTTIAPLSGYYLGDSSEVRARVRGVANQMK